VLNIDKTPFWFDSLSKRGCRNIFPVRTQSKQPANWRGGRFLGVVFVFPTCCKGCVWCSFYISILGGCALPSSAGRERERERGLCRRRTRALQTVSREQPSGEQPSLAALATAPPSCFVAILAHYTVFPPVFKRAKPVTRSFSLIKVGQKNPNSFFGVLLRCLTKGRIFLTV